MTTEQVPFNHPIDTPLNAGLRFVTELIAWVAAFFVAPGWWTVPVLAVLIGVPAVFSTPGDKRQVVVPTVGTVRVGIEIVLFVVALGLPWWVWPPEVCVFTSATVVAASVFGVPRWRWLHRGAGLS